MFISDIEQGDVLLFAGMLEIFVVAESKQLYFTGYDVEDGCIKAQVVDECGNFVHLELGDEKALINGEVTNDSIMWSALLVSRFKDIYLSWLFDQKIQSIEKEFIAKAMGRIHTSALFSASMDYLEKIGSLDDYMMQLEVMAQHLFESPVEDVAFLERKPIISEDK